MALLYMQQGKDNRALDHAQKSARLFTKIGQVSDAERAQQIVDQLKDRQARFFGRLFRRKG